MTRIGSSSSPAGGWTRREFLWRSALTGAGLAVASRWFADAPRVRVGIVGLGDRGRVLASCCAASYKLSLDAVCDQRKETIGRFRKRSREPWLAATDHRQLAGDPRLDALVLALPPAALERVALHAVERGKDVLIAPPVPPGVLDGDALRKAAERSRHVVAVLPRVAYTTPGPWMGSAAHPPRRGALHVSLPAFDSPPDPEGVLLEVADDVDFLRAVLGDSGVRPARIDAIAGALPGGRFEVRSIVHLETEGQGARLALQVDVSPSATAPRRAKATLEVPGRRIRLIGEPLRWDEPTAIVTEMDRFAAAVRERDPNRLTLPIRAAAESRLLLLQIAKLSDPTSATNLSRRQP